MFRAPFKQWIDNYLNFNRKDRNAIIMLGSLIILALFGHIIVDNLTFKTDIDREKVKKALAEWNIFNEEKEGKNSLFNFDPNSVSLQKLDSLFIPDFVKRNIISYREAGGKFKQPSDVRKIYGMNDSIYAKLKTFIMIDSSAFQVQLAENIPESFHSSKIVKKGSNYFDPNTADFKTLREFGFNTFQASNILKYREKGGNFERPSDLLRIYGIDSSFFFTVRDHIKMEKTLLSYSSVKPEKSEIKIELNSADSAFLIKLHGVGPVFASRIVKFRELLGGYYSVKQLLEVYNFPADTYSRIEPHIYTDTLLVKKIRVNFADFDELIRHPYLNKKHVAAIINYRDNNGAFKTVTQLKTEGVVDLETFEKIKYYLSCR